VSDKANELLERSPKLIRDFVEHARASSSEDTHLPWGYFIVGLLALFVIASVWFHVGFFGFLGYYFKFVLYYVFIAAIIGILLAVRVVAMIALVTAVFWLVWDYAGACSPILDFSAVAIAAGITLLFACLWTRKEAARNAERIKRALHDRKVTCLTFIFLGLGRVDGFDQDESADECEE
jgi:hypothetical protein